MTDKSVNQLLAVSLPIQGTDRLTITRDGINLLQGTVANIFGRTGGLASLFGLADVGNYFPTANVEASLQQIGAVVSGIFSGTGAPSNTNGNNGNFYFRSDGGALTTIYQKRSGSWVGIV